MLQRTLTAYFCINLKSQIEIKENNLLSLEFYKSRKSVKPQEVAQLSDSNMLV